MPLYAAWASNLDPGRMVERCPHSPVADVGWLTGWRLTFGGEDQHWDGALPMLVPSADDQVFVALYDISPLDEQALDESEGISLGLHDKLHVRVDTLDGPAVAWTYVLDAYEGGLPSARTLAMVSDAAEAAGAPDEYVLALRERPCQAG